MKQKCFFSPFFLDEMVPGMFLQVQHHLAHVDSLPRTLAQEMEGVCLLRNITEAFSCQHLDFLLHDRNSHVLNNW